MALLIVTCSCLSLSSEEQRVLLVDNPEHVKGCELVGRVRSSFGTHKWGKLNESGAAKENEDGLKKEAFKLGADTVLVVTDASNRGEAYNCRRSRKTPPTGSQALLARSLRR